MTNTLKQQSAIGTIVLALTAFAAANAFAQGGAYQWTSSGPTSTEATVRADSREIIAEHAQVIHRRQAPETVVLADDAPATVAEAAEKTADEEGAQL